MAAAFEFKPEERINESELSKKLGISRTPLREALNRLVARTGPQKKAKVIKSNGKKPNEAKEGGAMLLCTVVLL
jgi:hypothetical protein